MLLIKCTGCGEPYPQEGFPYLCSQCGGIFDVTGVIDLEPDQMDPDKPGLWKYWQTFGLTSYPQDLYMGEGNTALVWDQEGEIEVGFKLEYQNPSGSHKDRSTAVLVGHLIERKINQVVEDSSGNAGASLAGYAARAGIHASIYVPETASGSKREQIQRYGAELIPVPGERIEAAKQVKIAAGQGVAYASQAYIPFGLTGIATIAYELWEQTDGNIGSILIPVGHGGLLLGIIKGFEALLQAGVINKMPYFIGVQAENCSPVYQAYIGKNPFTNFDAVSTIAEGVRVTQPVRQKTILKMLQQFDGKIVAISEDTILASRNRLAKQGINVEPTSAIVWSALKLMQSEIQGPAILVMTGSSYKYSNQ